MANPPLTLLFDGACPLCRREVEALRGRDQGKGRICFVDIDAPDYDPAAHQGISYRQAMGRIHAIGADGQVIVDVAAFREAYKLVGWVGCTPPPPGPCSSRWLMGSMAFGPIGA